MTRAEDGLDLETEAFSEKVLEAFPKDPPYVLSEARFTAPALAANSFDDIYAARRDLQNYRVLFLKNPNPSTNIKKDPEFVSKVEEALTNETLFIMRTGKPYNLPPDTSHLVFWYRDSVDNKRKAMFLADFFIREGLGETDFVIVSSLKSRSSVPDIDHVHVFVRKTPPNLSHVPTFYNS